jgi:ATP-dependent helicase/nuclease subunit A
MAAQPDVPTLSCETPLLCRAYDAEALMAETEKLSAAPNAEVVNADATALIERMQFTYAYAPLARVPVKLAASDLAHRDRNADFVASRRPACMSEQGMTPAERGTAMHTFMQYAEYAAAKADVNAEADRLYEDGFLTAAQREVLDTACLQRFFDSDLYARMCAATAIWREYAFTVPLAATAIDPDLPAHLAQETLVVQGIADCVFEEDGQLVIVDYKTDRIRDPAQFIALYKKQLDIYKAALTRTLGKTVKETVLYAFHLNDVIHI